MVSQFYSIEEQTMGLHFIHGRAFTRQWLALGLSDDNLRNLEKILVQAPIIGSVMVGTGGLRKLRLAIHKNQGKSGGARVGYAFFPEHQTIFLIVIFAKAAQDNLSSAERTQIRTLLQEFGRSLASRK
jgi:hypothetical protein